MAATKRAASGIVQATTSGAWQDPKTNESHSIRKGETYESSHPVVKAIPDWFEPVERRFEPEVEQATASPGEKRNR